MAQTQFTFFQNEDRTMNMPYNWENWLTDVGHQTLKEATIIIYETPLSIVATSVAGFALLIIFPPAGNVCLGIVAGSLLSRLVIKVIDHYNAYYLIDLKDKAIETRKQYPNLWIIAFVFANCVTLVFPALGLAISLGYGAYKGILIQVDIYKYNQMLREKKLINNPNINY